MNKIDFSDVAVSVATIAVTMGIINKILETKTRNPKLHTLLRFSWLWMMLISMVISYAGYQTSYFTITCFFALYAIYRSKGFPPARMLAIAFVPFAVVSFVSDTFQLLTPNFFKSQKEFFNNVSGIALFWVIGFTIYAQRQAKRDKTVREKAELERQISEAKKQELEYQVAERTAELTQQKESLELALEELKTTQNQLIQAEKMASLGELTAGIAHEIQNPLNFVNNFSEVSVELCQEINEELEKSPLTPSGGIILNKDSKELLAEILSDLSQNQQKITHHGQRAASIVRGMLQHSRASNGQKEFTDINALADEYLRLSYHGLRAKDKTFNADFKTDLDPNLPKIEVIPQDFGRVLLNIVNNAFYAVQQKAKTGIETYKPLVSVKTIKTDNEIIIKISDNGGGMPENVKTKIFQPFFTTKPTGQGTGLGLSLSYDIITKGHGGTIEVESVEGEGTTFIITLPIK
jgi:two-component system, NtrC family, sensor kinase